MNKNFEITGELESWDVLVKRHIELINSKHGDYKTTIKGSEPHLYIVVTRVNFLTAKLWLERRNEISKKRPDLKLEHIAKPNWIIMMKSYRRQQEHLWEQK